MASEELTLTPLSSLRVSRYLIPATGRIPNSSVASKPILLYHGAFTNASATLIEAHLASVGAVTPQWRFTMYKTSHFHSTTHEVLCVSHGRAKLCFGGEGNPDRVELIVYHGDVMVLPAGVAHHLLEDLDGGFEMVGSYPPGHHWDMCYGKKDEGDVWNRISNLAWFERDPVYGELGPALDVPRDSDAYLTGRRCEGIVGGDKEG